MEFLSASNAWASDDVVTTLDAKAILGINSRVRRKCDKWLTWKADSSPSLVSLKEFGHIPALFTKQRIFFPSIEEALFLKYLAAC
mmetsp:Transcript_29825/g.50536  ORF Transcript_29825/g.50536 Transcript_29825/m.50536 type:complete len:85 (+) Transcript_29825:691-945(+)